MAAKFGVLALVEAKPGKEQDVWDFLNGGREIVLNEPGTRTWYAFRVNENTFGIFDTFDTEEDRQAHLNGAIPAARRTRSGHARQGPGHQADRTHRREVGRGLCSCGAGAH